MLKLDWDIFITLLEFELFSDCFQSSLEVRSILAKIGVGVEGEGEGEGFYSSFCFKCTLTWDMGHTHDGCDLLDNRIGRLLTKFQISATLSKKVLIFPPNCIHFQFNFKNESGSR